MKPITPTRKWPPTPAPVREPLQPVHPVVTVSSGDQPHPDTPPAPMARLTRHRVANHLTVTLDVTDEAVSLESAPLGPATDDRGRDSTGR